MTHTLLHADGAQALAGYRVIEMGESVAAAYCGKLFADFGAEVIKVEPIDGDSCRRVAPMIDAGDGTQESAYFAWLNTNKQSIASPIMRRGIDPRNQPATADMPQERARIDERVRAADVLIDARPWREFHDGPLSHDTLRRLNPRLIVVAISWYGESGACRDFHAADATCWAAAGLAGLVGPMAGPPAIVPGYPAQTVGGLSAFNAAMAGLLGRAEAGRRFSVSIHEANIALAEYQVALGTTGVPLRRLGVNRFAPTYPLGVFRCAQGWLGVTIVTPTQWAAFCQMLDMADAAAQMQWRSNLNRLRDADLIEPQFAGKLLSKTAEQWFELGRALRLPLVIVPCMDALLAQDIHRRRGAFGKVSIGAAVFEGPTLPQHLTVTPPRATGNAPRLDEHDAIARAGTDLSRTDADARARASADSDASVDSGPGVDSGVDSGAHAVAGATPHRTSPLPLAGIRILDLSMGWAGPLVTRHFADLGAQVIKVESCQYPDWWRGHELDAQALSEHSYEKRPPFLAMNRNKQDLTLNLSDPRGVMLFKRLVPKVDAVVENYSRGVLPKLGLNYAAIEHLNPALVMMSMPAFGSDSEWGDVRAYGSTLEHASGLPTRIGNADWPPTSGHLALGDPISGLNGTAALLIALDYKRRTGRGQHIDISQVECMLPWVAPWIVQQSATGAVEPRIGNRHPQWAPHGCFPCLGDDAWVFIAIQTDAQWQCLCAAMRRPDLAAAEQYCSAPQRRIHEDAIEAEVIAWTRSRMAEKAVATLQSGGICAAVVASPFDLPADRHLIERGFWQTIDRAFAGSDQPQASLAFREGDAPYPVRTPAPTLGQDNEHILRDLLGLDAEQIDALECAGVIGTAALPAACREGPVSRNAARQARTGETVR